MAKLEVEDDRLVVRLPRWEKAGALRGDVRVPLGGVEEVSVSAQPLRGLHGLRAPGAGWPRVIALGRRAIPAARTSPRCIAAGRGDRLSAGSAFARLLVSANDADAVAAAIT